MAPRDTFTGVGVGRKACSEAGEAIRWGHFLSRRLGVGSRWHQFDPAHQKDPRRIDRAWRSKSELENRTWTTR